MTPLTASDDAHPNRPREQLAAAAPPVLCSAGNVSLLSIDVMGMVRWRDVSADDSSVTPTVAHHRHQFTANDLRRHLSASVATRARNRRPHLFVKSEARRGEAA